MLLDYLRLFRLPNVFTALADIAAGFLLVQAGFEPWPILLCLGAASALLYMAGVTLNDVFDRELDAVERPERPIPGGRIPWRRAQAIGFALLLAGATIGCVAGYVYGEPGPWPWRPGAVAAVLAACILLYDALLKDTPLGPFFMGACRLFNVLLGMSIGLPVAEPWSVLGFGPHQWIVAGGIGLYIAGVTWFARTEATASTRWQLAAATGIMVSGIGVLGLLHRNLPFDRLPGLESETMWIALLALLAVTVVRRCIVAVMNPSPEPVQMAVAHAILSLVVLDAAVAVEVSDWIHGCGVLALLAPAVILGRWIRTT